MKRNEIKFIKNNTDFNTCVSANNSLHSFFYDELKIVLTNIKDSNLITDSGVNTNPLGNIIAPENILFRPSASNNIESEFIKVSPPTTYILQNTLYIECEDVNEIVVYANNEELVTINNNSRTINRSIDLLKTPLQPYRENIIEAVAVVYDSYNEPVYSPKSEPVQFTYYIEEEETDTDVEDTPDDSPEDIPVSNIYTYTLDSNILKISSDNEYKYKIYANKILVYESSTEEKNIEIDLKNSNKLMANTKYAFDIWVYNKNDITIKEDNSVFEYEKELEEDDVDNEVIPQISISGDLLTITGNSEYYTLQYRLLGETEFISYSTEIKNDSIFLNSCLSSSTYGWFEIRVKGVSDNTESDILQYYLLDQNSEIERYTSIVDGSEQIRYKSSPLVHIESMEDNGVKGDYLVVSDNNIPDRLDACVTEYRITYYKTSEPTKEKTYNMRPTRSSVLLSSFLTASGIYKMRVYSVLKINGEEILSQSSDLKTYTVSSQETELSITIDENDMLTVYSRYNYHMYCICINDGTRIKEEILIDESVNIHDILHEYLVDINSNLSNYYDIYIIPGNFSTYKNERIGIYNSHKVSNVIKYYYERPKDDAPNAPTVYYQLGEIDHWFVIKGYTDSENFNYLKYISENGEEHIIFKKATSINKHLLYLFKESLITNQSMYKTATFCVSTDGITYSKPTTCTLKYDLNSYSLNLDKYDTDHTTTIEYKNDTFYIRCSKRFIHIQVYVETDNFYEKIISKRLESYTSSSGISSYEISTALRLIGRYNAGEKIKLHFTINGWNWDSYKDENGEIQITNHRVTPFYFSDAYEYTIPEYYITLTEGSNNYLWHKTNSSYKNKVALYALLGDEEILINENMASRNLGGLRYGRYIAKCDYYYDYNGDFIERVVDGVFKSNELELIMNTDIPEISVSLDNSYALTITSKNAMLYNIYLDGDLVKRIASNIAYVKDYTDVSELGDRIRDADRYVLTSLNLSKEKIYTLGISAVNACGIESEIKTFEFDYKEPEIYDLSLDGSMLKIRSSEDTDRYYIVFQNLAKKDIPYSTESFYIESSDFVDGEYNLEKLDLAVGEYTFRITPRAKSETRGWVEGTRINDISYIVGDLVKPNISLADTNLSIESDHVKFKLIIDSLSTLTITDKKIDLYKILSDLRAESNTYNIYVRAIGHGSESDDSNIIEYRFDNDFKITSVKALPYDPDTDSYLIEFKTNKDIDFLKIEKTIDGISQDPEIIDISRIVIYDEYMREKGTYPIDKTQYIYEYEYNNDDSKNGLVYYYNLNPTKKGKYKIKLTPSNHYESFDINKTTDDIEVDVNTDNDVITDGHFSVCHRSYGRVASFTSTMKYSKIVFYINGYPIDSRIYENSESREEEDFGFTYTTYKVKDYCYEINAKILFSNGRWSTFFKPVRLNCRSFLAFTAEEVSSTNKTLFELRGKSYLDTSYKTLVRIYESNYDKTNPKCVGRFIGIDGDRFDLKDYAKKSGYYFYTSTPLEVLGDFSTLGYAGKYFSDTAVYINPTT